MCGVGTSAPPVQLSRDFAARQCTLSRYKVPVEAERFVMRRIDRRSIEKLSVAASQRRSGCALGILDPVKLMPLARS
jgi:hypothetical protein